MELVEPSASESENEAINLNERVALLEKRVGDLELSKAKNGQDSQRARSGFLIDDSLEPSQTRKLTSTPSKDADRSEARRGQQRSMPSLKMSALNIESATQPTLETESGLQSQPPAKCAQDKQVRYADTASPGDGDNLPLARLASAQEQPSQSPGSLEAKIGLYWLSRLGISFLVIGFARLISYTFQYFGPLAKIALGFAASPGRILLGELLEKRGVTSARTLVLSGGGWSLGFFTAYAMHHIPSVAIIENPLIGFGLMAAVAGGTIVHAVSKRSELMAILAVLLGFVTVFISPPGFFSAAASALLAVTAAILSVRMKWYGLNFTGLIAAYTGYAWLADRTPSTASGGIDQFWLSSAFLLPYWLSNLWTTMNLNENTVKDRFLGLATGFINSTAFLACWLPALHRSFAESAAPVYLLAGAVHLICSRLAQKRGQSALSTLYSLAGLTLITMYVPSALNQNCTSLAMAIEIAILTGMGLRYNISAFRWFSLLLSVWYFFPSLDQLLNLQAQNIIFPVVCQCSLVVAWTVASLLYRDKTFEKTVSSTEKEIAFYLLTSLAALLSTVIPVQWFDKALPTALAQPATVTVWALEAFAGTAIALKIAKPYTAVLSCFGLCGALLFLLLTVAPFSSGTFPSPWLSAVACGIMYMPALLSNANRRQGPHWTTALFHTQLITASLATTTFITAYAPAEYTSLLFTFQAFVLFLWGMTAKDRGLRFTSLLFFSIAILCQHLQTTTWFALTPLVAMLYTCGFFYTRASQLKGERNLRHIFNLVATCLLAVFAGNNLESGWISCAWALQAAALLTCGFRLQDRCLRLSGLSLFAVLIGKLLMVDLAAAETIHRILAFMIAGGALLGSSYAYSWFSRRLDIEANEAAAPESGDTVLAPGS